ncbi:alpha/beta hydrolase [Nonomuraea sp. NPDC050328]|uniref:alpha/beta hydrolase n=1 Tax=Nonomuraea sp. NPDC050328 TaxID=3364361 RepID=UPI0037A7831B
MSLRSLPAAFVVTAALLHTPAHAQSVTKIENTVEIRCAFTTLRQSSDWYFPSGPPKALLWLQHGFAGSNDGMTDTAQRFAADGFLVFAPTLPSANIFGCTLQNLGNNTAFLGNVADVLAGGLDRSFADARARAGRPDLALPGAFVLAGHSAGGEAVPYVAQQLRARHPAAFAKVRGLILFDPVKSLAGDNLGSSLNHLANTSLPILAISSPPYSCNSGGSGTQELTEQLARPFLGVRLTTGSHIDVEGSSATGPEKLACGTPQAQNVSALQTLAKGWAGDFVSGTTTPGLYPGGDYFESLRSAGVIQPLVP